MFFSSQISPRSIMDPEISGFWPKKNGACAPLYFKLLRCRTLVHAGPHGKYKIDKYVCDDHHHFSFSMGIYRFSKTLSINILKYPAKSVLKEKPPSNCNRKTLG